jgi:hypothetical protein
MNRRNIFSLALAVVAMPFAAKAKPVSTTRILWEQHYRDEPKIGVQRIWEDRTLVYSKADVYETLRGQYDFGAYEAFTKGRPQ